MADELRWEHLVTSVADGTLTSNSAAEFRNDSSKIIHIRHIGYNHTYQNAENDESGTAEISKSPVFASSTNNNVFFAKSQTVAVSATTGAAVDDTTGAKNGQMAFGQGQLTLEPNESLFLNVSKTSGGAMLARYHIGYHF